MVFRALLFEPPGIRGRYSSLLHVALLSALWRFDPSDVAARAALLAAGAADSHGRLLLLGTKSVQGATHRITQLVGGSTSGAGPGIIACNGASHRNVDTYREGAIAVALAMCRDDDAALQNAESRLLDQGVPTISIKLQTPADIGG